jgi:serine/threonine protein kinase
MPIRPFGPWLLYTRGDRGVDEEFTATRPPQNTPMYLERLPAVASTHHATLAQAARRALHGPPWSYAVQPLEVGRVGDVPYIVRPRARGWTLAQVWSTARDADHALPVSLVLTWLGDALRTLDELHTRALPVHHRDLSPRRWLLGPALHAQVLDLGLGHAPDLDLTLWPGTLGYLAPEYVTELERRAATPASEAHAHAPPLSAELYTLGVVAFELLMLERYLPRGPWEEMRPRLGAQRPLVRADLPRAVHEALTAMLALDPAARPHTTAELWSALAPYAEPGARTTAALPPVLQEAREALPEPEEGEIAEPEEVLEHEVWAERLYATGSDARAISSA